MKRLASLVALALAACGGQATPAPVAPAAPAAEPSPAADAPAADRPRYTSFDLDGNQLTLPGPIVFATGSAELDVEASAAALWYVHDYLAAKDYVTLVRVEGHGVDDGEEALVLTGDRALNVGRWLVAEGIDCRRLLAAAFGNTKPIESNATAEGRARNTRIAVVNAELRGKAIGGMPVDGGALAVPVCD